MRRPAAAVGRPLQALVQSSFGGLATRYAPLVEQRFRRKALVSENVNYDQTSIAKTLGDVAVLENAVGGRQIETFQNNIDWSGGELETGAGNYVRVEAEIDGSASRVLTRVGVGLATMEKVYSPPLMLGMASGDSFDSGFDGGFGSDPSLVRSDLDIFHVWRRPFSVPENVTSYQVRLIFETSTGNYFQAVVAGTGEGEEPFENQLGGEFTDEFTDEFSLFGIPLYSRIRRYQFTKTGTPSWESIAKVRIELQILVGPDTLSVAFDNLYWSPPRVQGLFQHRRFDGTGTRRKDEYAVAGGRLFRNGGQRWELVYSGFDREADVNHSGIIDRLLLSDGLTSPIQVLADGSIYRLGIAEPPKQIVLSQISGGQLATGRVWAIVKFYSTITGTESGVDDFKGTLVDLTGPNAGLRISNIPVSADPQVTHVRIFLRPENISNDVFFQASGDLNGEVENGATSFDFLLAVTELQEFESMDEDTDYPAIATEENTIVGGDVAASSSTTITLATDAPTQDDVLTGSFMEITTGAGAGQRRIVTDYNGTTRVATVAPAWTIIPSIGHQYSLELRILVRREAHPLYFASIEGYVAAVFAGQPWVLRFSQLRRPANWPLDNQIEMGEGDNDPISALSSGKHTGLAFKRDAVIPVTSAGEPTGLVASPSVSERGAVSHRSVVRIGEDTWYANESGIYWVDAALSPKNATAEAQPTWEELWSQLKLDRLVGVELRSRFQYILYGYSKGSMVPNRAMVANHRRFDQGIYLKQPSYDVSIHTYGAESAHSIEDSADLNRTWITRDCVVFRIDEGVSRDGRGFKMRRRTGLWSPVDGGGLVCRWPWIEFVAQQTGDVDLQVDVFLAGNNVPDVTVTANLKGQTDPLGAFILGTSKLGEGAYVYKRLRGKPRRSRYVQIELSHDGRGEVNVVSMAARFQPTRTRGEF